MAIEWTSPVSGTSYSVEGLHELYLQFTGYINEVDYNAYRFKLSTDSCVHFADDSQVTYTSEFEPRESFNEQIKVIGVFDGTTRITISPQAWTFNGWIYLNDPPQRYVNVTVHDMPSVATSIGVVYKGAWKGAIPYVVKNGVWCRAKGYISNGTQWKQLNT